MKPTINDVIVHLQRHYTERDILLFEGASDEDINQLEKTLRCRLPEDIKIFYRFTDGFIGRADAFRIIPIREINERRKVAYLFQQGNFDIAEFFLYQSLWTINRDIIDEDKYTIYNHDADLVHLTDSFAEFLDVFLKGGVYNGLGEWKQQIKSLRK